MRIRFRRRDGNAPVRSFWPSLRADSRGSTLVLVSLAMPVVIGALGLAVDTGLWYLEKRHLQQAADNASLGAVRALQAGATVADARAVAINDARRNGFVSACDTCFQFNSPPVSGAYAGKTNAVEIVLSRKLPVAFSAYLLSGASMVSARSVGYQSGVQGKNLEVALVLDASSSMASRTEKWGITKMQAQQSAANQLIDTVIQPNQSKFTSRVALAPFSSSVNVGSAYFKKATKKNPSGGWTGVVERSGNYRFRDEPPSAAYHYFGTFKSAHKDALGDYASFVQSMNSQTPGSANTIEPLSSSKTDLQAAVNGLGSNGTTAAHLGLAWAWYMLSPKWKQIFSGASTPNAYNEEKTYKAIVILSDFDFNTYYESGNGSANYQFEQLCTQIKAAGVKIFTIGYNTTGTSNNNRRINCASPTEGGTTYTFTTTTVDQLIEAFQAVARPVPPEAPRHTSVGSCPVTPIPATRLAQDS